VNKSTSFQPVSGIIFSGIPSRCFPPFLAVWGGQPKGEPPLADFKFHAARVRVCVGLAALAGVSCGIGGQPVLEVGVVCADIDQRIFFVKSARLLRNRGVFRLFSPALDLGKMRIFK